MLLLNGHFTKHDGIVDTAEIVKIKGNFLNVFFRDKRQIKLILLIYSKVFISYKMIYMHFELEVKLQVRC